MGNKDLITQAKDPFPCLTIHNLPTEMVELAGENLKQVVGGNSEKVQVLDPATVNGASGGVWKTTNFSTTF